MFDPKGRLMSAEYGFDPYNTISLNPLAWEYYGPMTSVAYRDQASWDFTPGTQADKLRYWHEHGMHRLPLRELPHLEATTELSFILNRQAE